MTEVAQDQAEDTAAAVEELATDVPLGIDHQAIANAEVTVRFSIGSGLRRTDLLWRAVGMAHTIRAHDPDCRVLVLTTELPSSTGRPAVRYLEDSGVPVRVLGAPDLLADLKALHD
jgi:hypothetical protein